ncbi:MAG TPA: transposase [Tepidisphaeraceae bacterium]|jgi:putative transposase
MPRIARAAPGGRIYHVLNRGNGRSRLFHKEADYAAFLSLLSEVRQAVPGMRVLAWCLMPNHWHLLLWPRKDGELASFMLRLTTAHVRRHFAHYHNSAGGHLYQGRYKSFPVQDDHHFLVACRYIEANASRSNLCSKPDAWRWGSLWAAEHGGANDPKPDPWPLQRPRDWPAIVNAVMSKAELERLRESLKRGRPYGSDPWTRRTAASLGLASTLRDRGRPRKHSTE